MGQIGGFDLAHICFEGKSPTTARVRRRARVPSLLGETAPRRAEPSEPRADDDFPRRVLARAGINPALYRRSSLSRRVAACLRALKVRSTDEALALLDRRPALLPRAVNAFLIGVTQFFRDPAVFELVRSRLLPSLADRRNRLRAWSAGCSNGAELYSFAVLLAEANLLAGADLLGTDRRPEAIAEAERSHFDAAAVAGVPTWMQARYFETVDAGARRPIQQLRAAVRWKVSDLSCRVEEGPWDVVLCRNVTIYLNPEPASSIVARLASVVRPGGYLVVGKAERPPARVDLERLAPCVYKRVG